MNPVILGDIIFGSIFFIVGLVASFIYFKSGRANRYLFFATVPAFIGFAVNAFDLFTNVFHLSPDVRIISDKIATLSMPLILVIVVLLYLTNQRGEREVSK